MPGRARLFAGMRNMQLQQTGYFGPDVFLFQDAIDRLFFPSKSFIELQVTETASASPSPRKSIAFRVTSD